MGTQPQSTCPRTPWKPGPPAKPPAPLSYWGQGGQGKPVSPPRGLLCSWNKTEPCGTTRVSQGALHRDNMNPNGCEAGTRGALGSHQEASAGKGRCVAEFGSSPSSTHLTADPNLGATQQQPSVASPHSRPSMSPSTASPPPLLPRASTHRAPQLGLPSRVCLPPS